MSSRPDTFDIDIEGARSRIAPLAVRTPLVPSVALTDRVGVDVFLKLETTQPTGAFKIRGAASFILSLSEERRALGVVTASTGNHGRAVSYVASHLGIPAVVCVSDGVPPGKVAALEQLGARVEVVGRSQAEAMQRALSIAKADGLTFVHPFDDPDVIAGQGTIAAEIAEDLPETRTVLVPLSGGGLLAGIAEGLRQFLPTSEPVGISMRRAPVMVRSLEAGHPIDLPEEETLADSLRGGIELDNRYTFTMVRDLVKRTALVDEVDIWEAMGFLVQHHRLVVEGGGAVGVAALLSKKVEPLPGPVVAVISGASAEPAHVAALIEGKPAPTL